MDVTNRLQNQLSKGFKLQYDKGFGVDPIKYEIMDLLKNAQFQKIVMEKHFKVLSDNNVFKQNEIYMN